MDRTVDIEGFRANIEAIVDDCYENGVRYTITVDGEPVAVLIPISEYINLKEAEWKYSGLEE